MPNGTVETKTALILEAKMTDEGHGTLSGYASVKNNVDSYGDVILDGAYAGIAEFVKSGWSGFNHEGAVGYITRAYEDQKGLFVEIAFHSDAESQSVRTKAKERLEAGKDLGMSIMYRTLEDGYREDDEKGRIRELKRIEVVEAGFVMLPANKAATVTQVKQGAGVPFAEQIDSLLVGIEDAKSRLETFQADRKQGLSETNIERAKSLRDGLDSLIAASVPPKSLDPEVLTNLAPDW